MNLNIQIHQKKPLLRIIGKHQNHPSIKLIKSKNKSQAIKFRDTNIDEIKRSIENLDFVLQSFIINKRRQISFLYIKRSQNYLKKNIDLLVFFQRSPRFT